MKRDLFLYLLRIYFPWLQKLSSSWNSNLSSKFSISPEHKYLQLLLSAMRCHDRELILHLSQMILAYVIAIHYFSPFQPSLTHTCPYFIKYQYSCFPFYITTASRSLRVQDRGTILLGHSSEIQQIIWAQVHPLSTEWCICNMQAAGSRWPSPDSPKKSKLTSSQFLYSGHWLCSLTCKEPSAGLALLPGASLVMPLMALSNISIISPWTCPHFQPHLLSSAPHSTAPTQFLHMICFFLYSSSNLLWWYKIHPQLSSCFEFQEPILKVK